MKAAPNDQIARSAIDPHGPTHVSIWLALALQGAEDNPARPITGAHSIAKCSGTGLTSCSTCVRFLAPLRASQQWVRPAIEAGACTLFADDDKYADLVVEGLASPERLL
jgi:hypothetical protein